MIYPFADDTLLQPRYDASYYLNYSRGLHTERWGIRLETPSSCPMVLGAVHRHPFRTSG